MPCYRNSGCFPIKKSSNPTFAVPVMRDSASGYSCLKTRLPPTFFTLPLFTSMAVRLLPFLTDDLILPKTERRVHVLYLR